MVAGFYNLGITDNPKQVAANVWAVAVIQLMMGAFLIAIGSTQEASVAGVWGVSAFNILVFAAIWFAFGFTAYFEESFELIGVHIGWSTIAFITLSVYWFVNNLPHHWSFGVANASYALVVFLLWAGIFEKGIDLKPAAYCLIIEAIVTVTYPVCALILGLPLP